MQSEKQPSYWAAGWATFAGLMLILIGIFHAISGSPRSWIPTRTWSAATTSSS